MINDMKKLNAKNKMDAWNLPAQCTYNQTKLSTSI